MRTKRWTDIADFVTEVMSKEGARPNLSHYMTLGNVALGIISETARLYLKTWTNAEGGDLAITGNMVPLPTDLLSVETVGWGVPGNYLDKFPWPMLDNLRPGWTRSVGDPDGFTLSGPYLYLTSAPSGDCTGNLTISGTAYLPEFSTDPNDPNPLQFIPGRFQLLPAYYILRELPVVPVTSDSPTPDAIRAANTATQLRMARKQDYAGAWQGSLAGLVDVIAGRIRQPFAF